MPAGRPRSYTPEIGLKICKAIASSQAGLRKTLEADDDLPEFGAVQEWLRGVGAPAQFSIDFAQAKRCQIEAMAEDIVDISRDDSLEPNDKRLRVDTLKWLLSKLIPRTYGDKLDVTSGGEALAVPAHQIEARITSIIMQAQARKAGEPVTLDATALKLLE